MNRDRRREILEICRDWQDLDATMSLKDCFFRVYDDRMMTASELESIIEWMTI
jgi:hypothetical protein